MPIPNPVDSIPPQLRFPATILLTTSGEQPRTSTMKRLIAERYFGILTIVNPSSVMGAVVSFGKLTRYPGDLIPVPSMMVLAALLSTFFFPGPSTSSLPSAPAKLISFTPFFISMRSLYLPGRTYTVSPKPAELIALPIVV